jgi:hypothetical protein
MTGPREIEDWGLSICDLRFAISDFGLGISDLSRNSSFELRIFSSPRSRTVTSHIRPPKIACKHILYRYRNPDLIPPQHIAQVRPRFAWCGTGWVFQCAARQEPRPTVLPSYPPRITRIKPRCRVPISLRALRAFVVKVESRGIPDVRNPRRRGLDFASA